MFFEEYGALLLQATGETLYMTVMTMIFGYLLGLPLGVFLYVTDKESISENHVINAIVGWIANMLRSIPFIILIVVLIPLTSLVIGTSIGPTAAIFALVIGAAPFIARMVESSLNEIDRGLIDCAKAMGATNLQIITRVLLPETLPSLIRGMSIVMITIIGYTAMSGTIGGGGLGDVAIRYGLHRYEPEVMWATVIILIIMVQVIQVVFDFWAKRIDKNV